MSLGFGTGIDLDKYDFDQYVRFVFDHPAPPMPREEDDKGTIRQRSAQEPWYFADEWQHYGTAKGILPHVIRLFRDPAWLLDAYTDDQLFQGFWYLSGYEFCGWLWNGRIDRTLRRDYALSMVSLEEKLFAVNQLYSTCYMWFDCFRTFKARPNRDTADYLLEALTQILYLPSVECRNSALHGLGHLKHPQKRGVLEKYLADHPESDDRLRDFIRRSVLTGKIL